MAKVCGYGKAASRYELLPAFYPQYGAMFRVENERNKEYMWVRSCRTKRCG